MSAAADTAVDLDAVPVSEDLSAVYFVRLILRGQDGTILSRNLYWKPSPAHGEDLTPLNTMPLVSLDGSVTRHDSNGRVQLDVALRNPGKSIALLAHLQLRRKSTGERVLPVFYSDNYLSIAPGEARTVTIDAAHDDLKGDLPLIVVDGWNVDVSTVTNADSALAPNVDASVKHWPVTGLPMIRSGLRDE